MIRQIKSTEDIHKAIVLLKQFVKETVYRDHEEYVNEMHLGKMIHMIMNGHYAWLAESNDQAVGILLAVKEPNMWAPGQKQMRELVWYVLPEYRSGSVAGRLFLEYCRVADELLKTGDIQGYFTSVMTSTTDINFESRGFKKMEQIYLKEQ
jgi:hypothetical protein